jgi:chemotaxis protein methyltransferase CheR
VNDGAVAAAGRVLARHIGLRVEGSAHSRLERALRERARRRGQAPDAYAGTLAHDRDELSRLIDSITVQESRFFRDPPHFAILRRVLAAQPAPGVVWSAGCANGQEPWSIAMLLEEAGAAGWRVLATDVSEAALERTSAGTYGDQEISALDTARRRRFLHRTPAGWRIADALRERVVVRRHTVVAPPPPEAGGCPIVFCRNVLIYLRPADATRALEAIGRSMPGHGRLFLGMTETLTPGQGGFVPERHGSAYVYRPAGSQAPRPPVRARAFEPRQRAPRVEAADAELLLSLARARLLGGNDARRRSGPA